MMIIELRSGDKKAIVDTKGGYLTNYSDAQGDIIYPKRFITTETGEQKVRGGCHVCMPNFGPGGDSGLDQHGYGRSSDWNIAGSGDDHVTLSLNGQGEYKDMPAKLKYAIGEHDLTMELTLTNNGARVLELGPAFHPYFATGEQLIVDGEPFDMAAYNTMVLSDDAQSKVLNTNNRTVTLTANDMPYWAQWSDRLSNYFCVEPSFGGFTFVSENHRRTDMLQPGESKIYIFTIA